MEPINPDWNTRKKRIQPNKVRGDPLHRRQKLVTGVYDPPKFETYTYNRKKDKTWVRDLNPDSF